MRSDAAPDSPAEVRPTVLNAQAPRPKHQKLSRGISSGGVRCCGLGRLLHHDPVAVSKGAIKLLFSFHPPRIQPLPLHGIPDSIDWRQASLRSFIDENEMQPEAGRDGPLPKTGFDVG